MRPYILEIQIALNEEELSQEWWEERHQRGARRAGGLPPELADLGKATLGSQTNPETGERFALVVLRLPAETGLARTRELAHTLISVLEAEGFTVRHKGRRIEEISGGDPAEPAGSFDEATFAQGRVLSEACLGCALSSDHRVACCGEGAAFSLADVGLLLLAGDDRLVREVLALPGQMDGTKWHPFLTGGRCIYHTPDKGCSLPRDRMPLQCRIYLCAPERLLPPELAGGYEPYVEGLEKAEEFISDHMYMESEIDFDSPLEALREAAAKAFAAWEEHRKTAKA